MFANALGPKAQVTSIEINEAFVEGALANVEVAGLSDRITFLRGSSTKVLATLQGRFDLVFLDHWKHLYKTDLLLMEERGLVGPGTIIVADNVGEVFDPDEYLRYVRTSGRYDCEHRARTSNIRTLPTRWKYQCIASHTIITANPDPKRSRIGNGCLMRLSLRSSESPPAPGPPGWELLPRNSSLPRLARQH